MPPSRAPSLSFTPAAGDNEDRAPDVMGDLPFLHTPHPSPVMGPVVARPALSDPPFLPSSIEDLLKPAALALLTAWLAAASTEWRACASGAQDRFRTPPLTLHQSDMVPAARGVVWDLRDPRGPPVPLSTSSRASRQPILRADRILTFVELHHYPDRALPQELAEGWRGHSDSTPLLTVLALPNAAFVANMASAIPSVRKDVENNLASLFPTSPTFPISLGANARTQYISGDQAPICAHFTARPRPVDGGHPDASGVLPEAVEQARQYFGAKKSIRGVAGPLCTP